MRALLLLLTLMVCSSCSIDEYTDIVDFPNQTWAKHKSVVFDFRVAQTTTPQRINILLRYRPLIEGHRVTLFVKSSDAANRFWIDTLHVVLGGGNGNAVRSQMVPYREFVMWQSKGRHTISINTDHTIDNIISMGIELK